MDRVLEETVMHHHFELEELASLPLIFFSSSEDKRTDDAFHLQANALQPSKPWQKQPDSISCSRLQRSLERETWFSFLFTFWFPLLSSIMSQVASHPLFDARCFGSSL
jgi:hypothetical protein